MLAIGSLSADGVRAQCVTLPGCELVWSDEFDDTAVDPTKWEFQLGDGVLGACR